MAPLNTDVIRLIVQAVADGVECAPTSDPPLRDGSAASTWLERAAALTRLSLVSRAWRQTAQHELSTWIYVRKDTLDVVEQAIECGTINRSAVKRVLSVGMGFKLDKVFALCTRVEAIHVQERPLHLDVLRFLVGLKTLTLDTVLFKNPSNLTAPFSERLTLHYSKISSSADLTSLVESGRGSLTHLSIQQSLIPGPLIQAWAPSIQHWSLHDAASARPYFQHLPLALNLTHLAISLRSLTLALPKVASTKLTYLELSTTDEQDDYSFGPDFLLLLNHLGGHPLERLKTLVVKVEEEDALEGCTELYEVIEAGKTRGIEVRLEKGRSNRRLSEDEEMD